MLLTTALALWFALRTTDEKPRFDYASHFPGVHDPFAPAAPGQPSPPAPAGE